MVNRDNYFVATRATFHAIPKTWVKKLLLTEKGPVKLGNMEFSRIYTSERWGLTGMSFSAYWESADGSTLVRVSDHWCGRGGTSKTKLCDVIADCYWRLSGKLKYFAFRHKECGVIRLTGGLVRYGAMHDLSRS